MQKSAELEIAAPKKVEWGGGKKHVSSMLDFKRRETNEPRADGFNNPMAPSGVNPHIVSDPGSRRVLLGKSSVIVCVVVVVFFLNFPASA